MTGSSLDGLIFRRPTTDDAAKTLALMIRRDVSEYGQPDADMEDLLHDWDQIDLDRDAWLAFCSQGDLSVMRPLCRGWAVYAMTQVRQYDEYLQVVSGR